MKTINKRRIFATLLSSFFIYTIFVYTTGTAEDKGIQSLTANAIKGKHYYQKYNCVSCHQIYGLGGYMGPDLTNVMSRYKENKNFIAAMLQTGSQRMPNFNMDKEEINAIVEYLNYINETGISPVTKFNIQYDGTITQHNE
ncbi:MAG: cytochrome c [Bacteroidia bacterium]